MAELRQSEKNESEDAAGDEPTDKQRQVDV